MMGTRFVNSDSNTIELTRDLLLKLSDLCDVQVGGIPGVAVKYFKVIRNTSD